MTADVAGHQPARHLGHHQRLPAPPVPPLMDAAFAGLSAVACLAMVTLFPRHARQEQRREDGLR